MNAPALLTILLPTYNERDNIVVLIERVLSLPCARDLCVLVVDDDSSDGTGAVVSETFRRDARVSVLNRRGLRRGLVPSLNHGISVATSELILWMDADLQMPAEKIPEFLDLMKDDDLMAVVGSRFISGGTDERELDGVRLLGVHKYLSYFLNRDFPALLGLPFTDITSGFIAIRKSYLVGYEFRGTHGEYFMELVHKLHRDGCRVKEIPYKLQARHSGISKTTQASILRLAVSCSRYLATFVRLYLSR